MSSEETLIEVRKQKHQELNSGTYPLSTGSDTIGSTLEFMESNPPPMSLDITQLHNTRVLHGRITNFRKSGGISFIKIADATGAIQCIASKAVLKDYDRLSLLDLGDIIELSGKMCLSKTSEKSILILEYKVLTKSHRPPPEKFLGISDQELKYRKRYLDLMSSEETRAVFVVRSHTIRAIRQFMENNNFMEVETSTLNTLSSGANAKPFTTHHNALETDLFLRIAPELYLKRLLVGGYEKVYEIGRAYRNEGISTRHNPEFTMIEFYEAYGRFHSLLHYAENLLVHVDETLLTSLKNSFALPYYIKWRDERPFTFDQFTEVTMEQAVNKAIEKLQMTVDLDNPVFGNNVIPFKYPAEGAVVERRIKVDINQLFNSFNKTKSRGERVALLFEHLVEPFLTEDYRTADGSKSLPVFITEYPVEICPLARRCSYNPAVCDRYELFIEGRELCNAFQELNDPDEQARLFKEQLASNNKDAMDYDADYIEALEYGMPPAIGFGMGIDRLVMLLTNAASIKDVILFPTLKPLK
jgi:lysyl-tRNA synthetase class 2